MAPIHSGVVDFSQLLRDLGAPITVTEFAPHHDGAKDASFRLTCTHCGETQDHKHGYLLPTNAIVNLIRVFADQHKHSDPVAALVDYAQTQGRPIPLVNFDEEVVAPLDRQADERRRNAQLQRQQQWQAWQLDRERRLQEQQQFQQWERASNVADRYRRLQRRRPPQSIQADSVVKPAKSTPTLIPIADEETGRKVRF